MHDFGLYVHFPYCLKKCPYCDFATVAPKRIPATQFIEAVTKEIRSWADRVAASDLAKPDQYLGRGACSIYLGGGTPSLFEPAQIARVLDSLDAVFGIAADAEITLEANPGAADVAHLDGYRSAGVNRLSIGLQSLDDRFLRALGRVHDAAEARRAVDKARTAGFANVSIDLIFAVPGMTRNDWAQTLEDAIALPADHVSAYGLTVEPETRLGRLVDRGATSLPEEETQTRMYELAVERLAAAGYPRYEISNFARPERESRHNNLYWTYQSYLSFGPSAHSFARANGGGTRWWNVSSSERYLDAAGTPAPAGSEIITGEKAMGEYLFTGLRRVHGISVDRFRQTFATQIPNRFSEALERFRSRGLTAYDDGRWRLTRRGFILSDGVFRELV